MNPTKLIRLSHLALIIGGLYELITPLFFQSRGVIGWVLIIIGLIGMHARQFKEIGWLGHIGFGMILISSFLTAIFANYENTTSITLSLELIGIAGIQVLGILLYAIATLRKKILPKSVGYLLLVSIVTLLFLGVGLGILGIPIGSILWIKKDTGGAPKSITSNQMAG